MQIIVNVEWPVNVPQVIDDPFARLVPGLSFYVPAFQQIPFTQKRGRGFDRSGSRAAGA